jgi:uroporphyrinogen-III synthase
MVQPQSEMSAKARVLLGEHPDQRDYIIEELRWKGWRVDELSARDSAAQKLEERAS